MKRYLIILTIALLTLSTGFAPAAQAAVPQQKEMTAEQKKKAAEKAKQQKEKEKQKAQQQKEKEKAAAQKEKEKAQAQKEKDKAAAEKAKAAQQKEKDKQKAEEAKLKEQAKKDKEKEKALAEKEKAAAEREQQKAQKEEEKQKAQQKKIDEYNKQKAAYDKAIAKQQKAAQDPTRHYINVWGKGGYAAMFDNLSRYGNSFSTDPFATSQRSLTGGGGAGIGLGYELEYNALRFNTGIEFNFLNSTSTYAFRQDRPMLQPYQMTYHYDVYNLRETRNAGYVGIPILLGAQFGRYFFMAGARVGLGVFGNWKNSGRYDVTATDPTLIDPLGGDPNLGLQEYEVQKGTQGFNGKLNLKQPELAVLGEFGIDLDEWLQYKPQQRRGRNQKKSFRESLHYKLSAFAEYGVLNNNASTPAMPLQFDNTQVAATGSNTMYALADKGNGGNVPNLNNLFVGVKFTVQYELPKKQVKIPAKPREVRIVQKPERQDPPVTPPPPPPTLRGKIYDIETGAPLVAQIELYDESGTRTLYAGSSDNQGAFATKLEEGNYASYITLQGYMPYQDTLRFVSDPLGIGLQPIKQGVKIVLENMYFATNKTRILPSSEQTLEDLYFFLSENPDTRVRIIGHTDSVGSDEANQRLSEGRAKAVRDDLIKRGIAAERLEAEGRGETEPIDTNDTEEGRQHNRRVEMEIL